jgi:hypothetical protein
MRRDHPRAAAWIERFTAGGYRRDAQAAGAWIDPAELAPILRRIEATYFPWVTGNRRALAAGEKRFGFESDGFAIDFPAGGYLEKCFATLESRFRSLSPADRAAIDEVLTWPA